MNCLRSWSSSSLLECIIPCTRSQIRRSVSSLRSHLVSLELVFWKDVSEYLGGQLAPLVGHDWVTVSVSLVRVRSFERREEGLTW